MISGKWRCYTLATAVADAKRMFRERFGYEASEIRIDKNMIRLGPIREEQDNETDAAAIHRSEYLENANPGRKGGTR